MRLRRRDSRLAPDLLGSFRRSLLLKGSQAHDLLDGLQGACQPLGHFRGHQRDLLQHVYIDLMTRISDETPDERAERLLADRTHFQLSPDAWGRVGRDHGSGGTAEPETREGLLGSLRHPRSTWRRCAIRDRASLSVRLRSATLLDSSQEVGRTGGLWGRPETSRACRSSRQTQRGGAVE